MDVIEIVLRPILNLLIILLAAVLAWINRRRIRTFLDDLDVRSVEVSQGSVKLERFERQIVQAYAKQGLGPPSDEDRRNVRSVGEHFGPYVAGRAILWVDDHPSNNRLERTAFVDLQVDVQACRSTEEALAELRDDPTGYDLVISDWTRHPQQEKDLPEGLRLLREIRASDLPIKAIPLIFYHGLVSETERAERSRLAQSSGATGVTGSPGELLRWSVAELVRRTLLDDQQHA